VAELTAEATRPAGLEAATADEAAHHPTAVSTEEDVELARSVLVPEEQLLAEAQEALARLDAGTFGRCQRCGQAITKTRLDSIPYARHCIKCARVLEGSSN
jgi:RNA polymerase-binding transcription factor DksA